MITWIARVKPLLRAHPRVTVAAIIVGTGVAFGGLVSGPLRLAKGDGVTVHEAQRSSLLVSIEESGTVKPVSETTVRNEVAGTSRIVYLVDEGEHVEEGDLLVELDASSLEDRVERRLLSYENRLADRTAAQSRLEIAESDAERAIQKAQREVDFSRLDLEKFETLERADRERAAELDVSLAEQTLRVSSERLRNSEALAKAGYETEMTVNRHRLAVVSDSARLKEAQSRETMGRRFDLLRRHTVLSAALSESQKALLRTKRESNGRVLQARSRLRSKEASLAVAQQALDEAQAQLAAATIRAPREGMVVYGGSTSRVTRESMIEEGAMVRERQELITIPDTSRYKITVNVHETVASDVRVGQDALVTLEASPERLYRGRVSFVSLLPERSSFWSSSQARVYKAEITLNEKTEEIAPGASGRVQIVLHYLEDVVTVPIDAVTTIEGEQSVEVVVSGRKTELRPVEIGVHNDREVPVLSGLEPGEIVMMRDAG